MSSSTKLSAMRAWVAALKAHDDAWAPYQQRGAEPPSAQERQRLASLSAEVERTYQRYHELAWTDSNGAA